MVKTSCILFGKISYGERDTKKIFNFTVEEIDVSEHVRRDLNFIDNLMYWRPVIRQGGL